VVRDEGYGVRLLCLGRRAAAVAGGGGGGGRRGGVGFDEVFCAG
jgi:hypothetical protein